MNSEVQGGFMKEHARLIARKAATILLAIAMTGVGAIVALGADRDSRPPEGENATRAAEAVRAEETAREADTNRDGDDDVAPPKRRQALREVVSIGSQATVGVNQVADQVVVVNGDAQIEGEVRGDLVVIFGKARVTGRVRGDIVVVLGEAMIDGRVRGDTTLVMSRGRFGAGANVDGDVTVVGVEPEIDPAASLKSMPEVVTLGPLVGYFEGAKDYLIQGVFFLRPFPPRVGWVWIAAGLFLLLHLLIAALVPRPLTECMDLVRNQPVRSFLVGLLAWVLVGPVSLLLSFTVIAPLLIWMAFFAVCIFGRVAAYGAAGETIARISGRTGIVNPIGAVLVGSLVLYVSYMIPVVGLLLYGLVLPLGAGAVLIRIFDGLRRDRPPTMAGPRPENLAAASALVSGHPGPATHGFVSTGASDAAPMTAAVGGGGASAGTPVAPPTPTSQESVSTSTPPSIGAVPPVNPPRTPPQVIPLGGVEALAAPRVGFWPRLGASCIDVILISVINLMTFREVESFWFLFAIYHIALWAWKGTTVGGSVLNLKLVRLDGRAMDWQTAVVRMLGAVVSLVPLGLGFLWTCWDPDYQSWHDRIAGTTVVRPEQKVTLV